MIKLFTKKRKGFTLIELIVVIAILGILAAIAIPRIGGFTDSAKEQADKVMASTIKNATAMALANGDIVATNNTGSFTVKAAGESVEDITGITKPSDDNGILTLISGYVDELTNLTKDVKVTITDTKVEAEVVKVPQAPEGTETD
jgi:type IV pilus assembly protein PilA